MHHEENLFVDGVAPVTIKPEATIRRPVVTANRPTVAASRPKVVACTTMTLK